MQNVYLKLYLSIPINTVELQSETLAWRCLHIENVYGSLKLRSSYIAHVIIDMGLFVNYVT
jgi:hypothetical protein